MTQEKEAFLSRWSRLKRDEVAKAEEPAPAVPATAQDAEQAPPLQPVEELTPESDFTPFMHAKVPAATRSAALKKLFSDPQFNVPDLNEAYSGDWTGGEPIPLEMLKTLNQAKKILFDEPSEPATPTGEEPAAGVADSDRPTDNGIEEAHGAAGKDA